MPRTAPPRTQLVIIGAGGHGKVALDVFRAAGRTKVVGFVDADPSLTGTRVAGVPVLGTVNVLPKLRQQKVAAAFVAIGDNRARQRYAAVLREHGFRLINAIHPTAFVSDTATLGENVLVAAGGIVGTESRVGDCAIVNTAAVVDHECEVGEAAHLCPGVHLAGRVRVGPLAFVGIGANVIQCLSIGEAAVVGAGAAVIRDVPAFATVVGVPASIIKVNPSRQPHATAASGVR